LRARAMAFLASSSVFDLHLLGSLTGLVDSLPLVELPLRPSSNLG